jgi:hypothetical protein
MGFGGAQLNWAASLAFRVIRNILRRLPSPPRGLERSSELLNEVRMQIPPPSGTL